MNTSISYWDIVFGKFRWKVVSKTKSRLWSNRFLYM